MSRGGVPVKIWMLFGVMFGSTLMFAQEEVIAKGQAPILGGNQIAARSAALDQALRNAVEQTVGTLVVSESFSRNFALIHDEILSQSSGYVSRYEVMMERTSGEIFDITVRAWVSKADLNAKLAALGLIVARTMPRIAVILVDKNAVTPVVGSQAPVAADRFAVDGISRAKISDCFLERQFVVLDMDQVKENLKREELDALLSLDPEKANALGLRLNVDLLAVGETYFQGGDSPLEGFKTATAVISMKIHYTDTGQVIASKTVTENMSGISVLQASTRAMEKAAVKLCDQLTDSILSFWTQQTLEARVFTLTFSGMEHAELMGMISYLQGPVGAKHVVQREYNTFQSVIDVKMEGGNIDQLVSAILSPQCPVAKWELRMKSQNRAVFTKIY